MTDWPSILKAIRREPADNTIRLAAADFLEEEGIAEWAELIRLQIGRDSGLIPGGPSYEGQIDGLIDVIDWGLPTEWLGVQTGGVNKLGGKSSFHYHLREKQFLVSRGFISEVCCDGKDWPNLAPYFISLGATSAHLLDWPPINPTDWRDRWGSRSSYTLIEPTTGASARVFSVSEGAVQNVMRVAWPEIKRWRVGHSNEPQTF